MSRLPTVAGNDVTEAGSVRSGGAFLSGPHAVAAAIGMGRTLLGAAALAAPVAATRVLGLDSATAKRVTLLARMAAARDIGIGAGTLAAGTLAPDRAGAAWWLVAGAFADAVDAAAMAGALRRGTVRGLPAAGIAVGAGVSAGIALRAAVALRRGRR